MLNQLFCLLVMTVTLIAADEVLQFKKGKTYVFGRQEVTWEEAEKRCQGRDGHLVVVRNELEWIYIYGEAKKLHMRNFWIGLNDRKEEGTFVYDYEQSAYRNWSKHEPDNWGNEDCVHEWNNGFWSDASCENHYQYVCEVHHYIGLVEYRGAAYFFGNAPKTNTEAVIECNELGGHLTSVSDEAEWNFIYYEARRRGLQNFWIGLNDKANEGHFVWDDGSKHTYTKWNKNEPNNFGGNENCTQGQQWNNGFWNDIDCRNHYPYVCKVLSFRRRDGSDSVFDSSSGCWIDAPCYLAKEKICKNGDAFESNAA